MADQSDVETALAGMVGAVLYPQGADGPSILGRACRIYRGWPNAGGLDADLAAGAVNVTILPEAGQQENTTRWTDDDAVVSAVRPGLTLSVSGQSVTAGGVASLGQVAGVLADGFAAVHRTRASDTPASVAAALGAALRPRFIVALSGATLTVPGAGALVARVVADQTVSRQTRRQRQTFRVSCWCPDPGTRDTAAGAIDAALSAIDFIALADGTSGRLRFRSSMLFDQSQEAALYRRDLVYSVDYATTLTAVLPSLIISDTAITPDASGVTRNQLG